MVSRFFTRMVGLYEEEELLMQLELKYMRCQTKHNYPSVYIEIARGDAKFITSKFAIEQGINEVDIERTFYIRTSKFYRDKDSPPDQPVYQPKVLDFRLMEAADKSKGINDPKPVAVGMMHINEYCHQIRKETIVWLTESKTIMDLKLQMEVSVVRKDRMKNLGGGLDFDQIAKDTKKQGDKTQESEGQIYRRETIALATGKQFSYDKADIAAAAGQEQQKQYVPFQEGEMDAYMPITAPVPGALALIGNDAQTQQQNQYQEQQDVVQNYQQDDYYNNQQTGQDLNQFAPETNYNQEGGDAYAQDPNQQYAQQDQYQQDQYQQDQYQQDQYQYDQNGYDQDAYQQDQYLDQNQYSTANEFATNQASVGNGIDYGTGGQDDYYQAPQQVDQYD